MLTEKPLKNKVLVLDLDETLVHSSDYKPNNWKILYSKINWKNSINKSNETAYTWIRPGAHKFLAQVSKLFEIMIFTASVPGYAKEVVKLLDHQNDWFPLFSRNDWIFQNGKYIKELSVLNRDLKHTIIVDNWPDSFCLNKFNGVPISSWYDDPNDNELEKIFVVLEYLNKVDDVRESIPNFVINNRISISRLLSLSKSVKLIDYETTNSPNLFRKLKNEAAIITKDESTNEESNDSNQDNYYENHFPK